MTLYPFRKNNNIKGNKNPQEIFYESTQKLFRLLSNHPYFLSEMTKLRSKYKLPYKDITDIQKLLVWQHDNKEVRNKIVHDRKLEALLVTFLIPKELQKATLGFMYDFLPTDNIITASSYETGLNVIKVTENEKTIELNPNYLYLEITPHTTIREIKDRWKKIVDSRKEIRGYGIPSTSKIEERVWKLYQQGKGTDEIVKTIGSIRYGYNEVLALKNNYKKALFKLRKLD